MPKTSQKALGKSEELARIAKKNVTISKDSSTTRTHPMVQRRPRLLRVALMILVVSATLLLLISTLHRHFNPAMNAWRSSPSSSAAVGAVPWIYKPHLDSNEVKPKAVNSAERTIHVGLQIENIYDLSLKNRSFKIEGWYWLKWPEKVNTIIKEYEIDQNKIIDFTNRVDSNSLQVDTEQPNPERLSNGSYWQSFHFSGFFYIEDLLLRAFPFDELQLPIMMELGPDALSCYPGNRFGCFSLVFDKNANPHALGQYVDINGYSLIGTESREFLHQYSTSFGRGTNDASSAVQMNVIYRANFAAAFWIYIFPWLILVGISIASPSLPGSLGDVRLAIPTTILLTLIFLQISYKADLPALDYVSYLDWLYIYAYTIAGVLFLLFCWGTNAHTNAEGNENEALVLRQINRVDGVVQGLAFAGLVLVMGSGLFFQP